MGHFQTLLSTPKVYLLVEITVRIEYIITVLLGYLYIYLFWKVWHSALHNKDLGSAKSTLTRNLVR